MDTKKYIIIFSIIFIIVGVIAFYVLIPSFDIQELSSADLEGIRAEAGSWWQGNSPTAYWKLNENSIPAVANDTIGVYNLTNAGGTSFVTGLLSNASSHSGNTNDRLYFTDGDGGNLSLYKNNFTIVFWMNTTSGGATNDILFGGGSDNGWGENADGWHFQNSNGEVEIYLREGESCSSNGTINDGKWHRIVVTRNHTTQDGVAMYVDGVYNVTCTITDNLRSEYFGLGYGGGYSTTENLYVGLLDDVAIYNGTVWSAEDVTEDWNSGAGKELDSNSATVSVSHLWPADLYNETVSKEVNFQCNSTGTNLALGNSSILIYNSAGDKTNWSSKSISGTYNITNHSIYMAVGEYNWSCIANATDNLNTSYSGNRTMYVHISAYSSTQSSDKSACGEGDEITFNLWLNLTDIETGYVDTYSKLWFNKTDYTDTTKTNAQNYTRFTRTVTVPSGYGVVGGYEMNWSWDFAITNSTGTLANTSTANVSLIVYKLDIDDCSTYPMKIINVTLSDEETDVNLSLNQRTSVVDVEVSLTSLSDDTITDTYSNNFTNHTNFGICLPDGLINYTNYSMDFISRYETTDYVEEYYYMDNFTLTNLSYPKNITLRDLLSADSTSFLVSYTDEDNLLVDNAIISPLRKYVANGTFKEVEAGKTNNDGQTILHLVEEDVVYIFNVTKQGTRLFTSEEYRVYCVSGEACTIDLDASKDVDTFIDDWDRLAEGTYNITSNQTTRIIRLAFSLNESHTMNLTIYKFSNNETEMDTIVDQNTTTASSGDVTLYVPYAYSGNSTYYAVIRKDNEFVGSHFLSLRESGQEYFGTLGIFMAGLIVLTLGLMAVSQGVGVIVFAILGLIIASVLMLIDTNATYNTSYGGFALVMFLISAGIILIIKIQSRRSRG